VNLTLTEPGRHLQSMLDPQKPDGDPLGALIVAGKTLVLRNIGIGRGSLFRNRISTMRQELGFIVKSVNHILRDMIIQAGMLLGKC
jgi:hypothetical protein